MSAAIGPPKSPDLKEVASLARHRPTDFFLKQHFVWTSSLLLLYRGHWPLSDSLFFHVSSFIDGSGNQTCGDGRHGELSNDPVRLRPSRIVLCKKLGHGKNEKIPDNKIISWPLRGSDLESHSFWHLS